MQGAISTMDVAILDKFFQVWEKDPVMYNDFCSAIGGLLERLLTWLMANASALSFFFLCTWQNSSSSNCFMSSIAMVNSGLRTFYVP